MANTTLVIGLGFGDEGKGTIVDYLARHKDAKLVVRFNGGAQAGHNVIGPSGQHHCFSQWGSGTLVAARTLLSRHVLVNPIFAESEARHLESIGVPDPYALLSVERDAPVTTPFHVAANRCRELARQASSGSVHGSCGMGVGETMEDLVSNKPDPVYVRDIEIGAHAAYGAIRSKLARVQERKRAEVKDLPGLDLRSPRVLQELFVLEDPSILDAVVTSYAKFARRVAIVGRDFLERELDAPGHVVFEGAQGVLLDEWWGFHPHTTWSTCTFDNATEILGAERAGRARRIGVLRTFHTRHGAGPFPTENKSMDALSADDHNKRDPWQHDFRSGAFDLLLTRYALDVCGGCDGLAFTHLDKLERRANFPVAVGYYVDGAKMVRIPRRRPNDLQYQERLGQQLAQAQPIYAPADLGGERPIAPEAQCGPGPSARLRRDEGIAMLHVEGLAELLETPLAIVSRGKTAADKIDLGEDAHASSRSQATTPPPN